MGGLIFDKHVFDKKSKGIGLNLGSKWKRFGKVSTL